MNWADLFERAEAFGVTEDEIRGALARRRADGGAPAGDAEDEPSTDEAADAGNGGEATGDDVPGGGDGR